MATLHPYTHDPGAGPYVIFPTHAHQILSNCIHIIGTSVISYCFARRTETEFLWTKQGWQNISWTKLLVILLFLDSWFFLAFSGILVNGVGLSYSVMVCNLGIYACIVFYAGSKALIYIFLVERVWIVWSAGNTMTRRQSPVYQICATIVAIYIAIFVLMIVGRVVSLRQDGTCVIGLRPYASVTLLTYDLFVNVFLTSMFIWPLYRENLMNARLRSVAWRTMFAAAAALTTSSVNMAILTALHGKQLGWVCLASCAADVTLNALVLYWVTAGGHRESIPRNLSLPALVVPVSFVRVPDNCVPAKSPASPPPRLDTGDALHQGAAHDYGHGRFGRPMYASGVDSLYDELPTPDTIAMTGFREVLPTDDERHRLYGCDRAEQSTPSGTESGTYQDPLEQTVGKARSSRAKSLRQASVASLQSPSAGKVPSGSRGAGASGSGEQGWPSLPRRKTSRIMRAVRSVLGLWNPAKESPDMHEISGGVNVRTTTSVHHDDDAQQTHPPLSRSTVVEDRGTGKRNADVSDTCERTPVDDLENALSTIPPPSAPSPSSSHTPSHPHSSSSSNERTRTLP
ncbi:hypothetical protein BD410DRAFT_169998 [Rickenella mellea]|uniref:Transmembrane protein n=1 Tax=Rickenella mellea TaxID=50990 RepID=A0A4Y7Q670_9AGAM|nr:hypothetical protein BD410DRAFT_169998 [Rickenella mellea]